MNVLTCFNTILFDGTLADVHSPMAISGSLEFYSIPPLEQLDEVQEVRPLAVPLGNYLDVGHYCQQGLLTLQSPRLSKLDSLSFSISATDP